MSAGIVYVLVNEAFDSYVAQVNGFEQATQWNRRLQYYVEQAR